MAGEKDRKMIWDDCPQCAYKHLAAAYAAITSEPVRFQEGGAYVPADRVLYARAHILKRESESGYPGNLAAAIGCLAAAEGCMRGAEDRLAADAYRHLRLQWSGEKPADTPVHIVPTLLELASAHMVEASRELPEAGDMFLYRFFSNGDMVADGRSQIIGTLIEVIRWVEETYCIGSERVNQNENS